MRGDAADVGSAVVRRGEPAYPPGLEALRRPPPRLYVRGEVPCPWGAAAAIVGSREADAPARRAAAEIAAGLAAAGVIVVSGGARGVDTAAHEGALARGGRTVAFMGSGFAHPYPPANAGLFARIAAGGGAVITELEPATPPSRWSFPRRNRLIAAVSALVLVVQAPGRSGALLTAAIARRLGVRVAAVPWAAADPRCRGSNGLLKGGAALVESAADAIALMHRSAEFMQLDLPEPPARCKETPATVPAGLGADELSVLEALGAEPAHIDEIAARTGLGAARTQAALLVLELEGLAADRGGKSFARAG